MLSRLATKAAFKDDTIQEMMTSTVLYMISDLFDIFSALVTLYLISKISVFENRLYEIVQEENAFELKKVDMISEE
jgi:hypothetical protein